MLRLPGMPTLVGLLAVVLAAGCGGGGGGGGSSGGAVQPVISGGTPMPGMTGVPYPGFTFTVASGGVAPFTWSETGALPAGMSFSPSGQLSGTPATAGTYPITVTVADSSTPALMGTPDTVNLVIQDSTIVVATTPAPPAGTLSNRYPFYFFSVASGGAPPFAWTITAGALPPGLRLGSDGSLTGTATMNGTFVFTVTATDSATPPGTGSAQFTIMVSNPPPPTINNTPPPTGTVGVAYPPFQFTATNGLAPFSWGHTGAAPGLGVSLQGSLAGTPTTEGRFPITVKMMDALSRPAPDAPFTVRVSRARPAAAFTLTGSMGSPRFEHSATLLIGGKVLVAGGPFDTAELYDPATGMFAGTTGRMSVPRARHTATLLKLTDAKLPNYGKVLIAGGTASTAAELYDPATETFTPTTGNMTHTRVRGTATLLNTNKVLLAGGFADTAELYDPASNTFAATGSLGVPRIAGLTATLLLDGRVLVAGGGIASAELYDPVSGKFAATGSMTQARSGHTATLLNDNPTSPDYGKVLVVGTDGTADLYDPGAGTFAAVGNLSYATGPSEARTASLRKDGTVLVAGGSILEPTMGQKPPLGCTPLAFPVSVDNAALFAQESEGFTTTGHLNVARDGHTATVLSDGSTVLIVGGLQHSISGSAQLCTGRSEGVQLSSAELFK